MKINKDGVTMKRVYYLRINPEARQNPKLGVAITPLILGLTISKRTMNLILY
jgi:hypothetical protein